MGGKEQNSPIYISRIIPGGVADRYEFSMLLPFVFCFGDILCSDCFKSSVLNEEFTSNIYRKPFAFHVLLLKWILNAIMLQMRS